MTDEPKEPEDELEQAPPERPQDEEAMRQAGHEDPEQATETEDEGERGGEGHDA